MWINIAIIIILLFLIIYYLFPEVFPAELWKYKSWRIFSKNMDMISESFSNNVLSGINNILDNPFTPGKSEGFDGDESGMFPLRGSENTVNRPVMSYYKTFEEIDFGKDAIIVGLHYTDWCHYCKLMKPIWFRVKRNLESGPYSAVKMVEVNEDETPTRGINGYPTIIKYRGGKARKYDGLADYNQLREWILSPFQVDTYGSAW